MGRLSAASPDGDEYYGPVMDLEALMQWCAVANSRRVSKDMGWWYYVAPGDDGRNFVAKAEGWKAEEMRARASGKEPEWYHPSEEEAAATHEVIGELIAKGIPDAQFDSMVRRGAITRLVQERLAGRKEAA